jgi:hypothetical protein
MLFERCWMFSIQLSKESFFVLAAGGSCGVAIGFEKWLMGFGS